MMPPTLTRANDIATQLRAEISQGVLLSGERLREMALAGRLGVSQATVREALALLEREGWVAKQPRRGVYVRAFSPAEADDIYALIGVLMPLVFERVIDATRKPRLRDLTGYLDAAQERIDRYHGEKTLHALFEFDLALALLAERPATGEVLVSLLNRAQIIEAVREARAPLPARDLSALVLRHRDLQRALAMGDLDLACRLFAPLIDLLRAGAVEALETGGTPR
jgi:DNA-binding GntR family transcriptional regulator